MRKQKRPTIENDTTTFRLMETVKAILLAPPRNLYRFKSKYQVTNKMIMLSGY